VTFFKTPIGRVAAVVLVVLIIALLVVLIRGVDKTSKGPGTGDARPVPELRVQAPAAPAAPAAAFRVTLAA
jgi:negative regulator of sigma E activity